MFTILIFNVAHHIFFMSLEEISVVDGWMDVVPDIMEPLLQFVRHCI